LNLSAEQILATDDLSDDPLADDLMERVM
jgi:hypothetical protein